MKILVEINIYLSGIHLKEILTSVLFHGVFNMYLLIKLYSAPYTPLEKKTVDNTDDETLTEEWTLDQPVSQTRTTAIVEVKGTVDIVLTPLVAEALDRY